MPLAPLRASALLLVGLACGAARADDPPPEPPVAAPEAAPEPEPPAHLDAGATSALTTALKAVRHGDEGSLGERDFKLGLMLENPGAGPVTIRAGNVYLRSPGGWLSPLAPLADLDMFARGLALEPGSEQLIDLDRPYKVLGPGLDAVVVLEASDGWVHASAPLEHPEQGGGRVAQAQPWPLGLGVHHPLEAVAYADGPRSIVVVGQVQLLAHGTLTKVEGSLLLGDDGGTTSPQTWTGGVEDGQGPGLWPFVQRLDVPEGFEKGLVSLRLKAELDGKPVTAALDLPARRAEPFTCRGPVLGHWQLANGPAERRPHANLLQLRSRYAWDFVVLKDGQTYVGDVSDNAAYFAWNQTVYAVADGVVADLCDHQPDRSGAETSAAPCVHTPVNRLVLRHADGTFTAYLHLRENSAKKLGILKGSKVRAGQAIARVGNSGASSEPHLMFFAFRKDEGGTLVPVPVAFQNAFADAKGEAGVAGVPEGGSQLHFLDPRALAARRPNGR